VSVAIRPYEILTVQVFYATKAEAAKSSSP
jgi:hypothetical protein